MQKRTHSHANNPGICPGSRHIAPRHEICSEEPLTPISTPSRKTTANLFGEIIKVKGVPRTGYFILGRDGVGAWLISRVVRVARALFVFVRFCVIPQASECFLVCLFF